MTIGRFFRDTAKIETASAYGERTMRNEFELKQTNECQSETNGEKNEGIGLRKGDGSDNAGEFQCMKVSQSKLNRCSISFSFPVRQRSTRSLVFFVRCEKRTCSNAGAKRKQRKLFQDDPKQVKTNETGSRKRAQNGIGKFGTAKLENSKRLEPKRRKRHVDGRNEASLPNSDAKTVLRQLARHCPLARSSDDRLLSNENGNRRQRKTFHCSFR